MENKKKKKEESNLVPRNPEMETNEYLEQSNEDQSQTSGCLMEKNSKPESPSHENLASQTQQYPPILEWSYTTQTAAEESSLLPKHTPCAQQHPPVAVNQRQPSFLSPQQQQHPTINQMFWRPGSIYQPFPPMATTGSGWQAPMVTAGASSGNESAPTCFYQGGYTYPTGFPGLWDPSWWGQAPQSQPHYAFPYPAGGYGYFAAPPPHQRGIIRPQGKLSQKHQQMWEAQSAENCHLWTAISHMEAEMTAYKNRIIKLEAEVSTLKQQSNSTMNESAGATAATSIQPTKRGRPRARRPIASINTLPYQEDSQPRPRGRKSTSCKVQLNETTGLGSEKESLNIAEDTLKTCHPMLQEGNTVNFSTAVANASGFELNESKLKLATDTQVTMGFHIRGPGLGPNSEVRAENRKTAFSFLPQNAEGVDTVTAAASYTGTDDNINHGWPSNMLSEENGRNASGLGSRGWNFVSGNVSEEHEDMEEEEMEDGSSSAIVDLRRPEAEANFNVDPLGLIEKGLPQLNRW